MPNETSAKSETQVIRLQDIMHIPEPGKYKLHLACRDRSRSNVEPLDDFVDDANKWLGWNEWRHPKRNDWTRDYVLSFMEFYPRRDTWLFGGGFKVLQRHRDGYQLLPMPEFQKYVGRLLVLFHRYQGMRGRGFNLENYLDELEATQILESRDAGEVYCGYDKICHDFRVLEHIFRSERADWKAALSDICAVYVIADKLNGKKYVGSAYGDGGLWHRWSCYMKTGHGSNDELVELINKKGIEYARRNFRFAILEVMAKSASDQEIRNRESHWKEALMTREHGYNRN